MNEGFATLFEHIGTDLVRIVLFYFTINSIIHIHLCACVCVCAQVHPDWDIFQSFLANKLHLALQIDATERTRPMTYYIESPRGVQGLFDNIAYAKCNLFVVLESIREYECNAFYFFFS